MNNILRYFTFSIIFALPVYCSYAQDLKTIRGKKAYLQKYAVCQCIYYGFKNQNLDIKEKDNSESGIADLITEDDKVFNKIDQLAQRFVSRIKPIEYSQDFFRKPIIMDCLYFYHSDSLKILLKNIKLTKD